jgi:hypothetical protein
MHRAHPSDYVDGALVGAAPWEQRIRDPLQDWFGDAIFRRFVRGELGRNPMMVQVGVTTNPVHDPRVTQRLALRAAS